MKKIVISLIVVLSCLSFPALLVSCSQEGEEAEQQVSEETEPLKQTPAAVGESAEEMAGEMEEGTAEAEGEMKEETTETAGGGAEGVQVAKATQGDPAKGKETYNQICASCHGPGGKGDGPAAAALDPKPRNFTDAGYMSKLTNEHMFKVISEGGASVGLSAAMPPWGGTLSEQDIWNVIAYVRQDICGGCEYKGE